MQSVGGILVNHLIATQVQNLLNASRAAGLTLTGGGYRDPQAQIQTRMSNCGTSQYAIYQEPASQCSPPTAIPGTSMHEQGLAIDFSCNGALIQSHSDPCWIWLNQNAASFGLYNLASEPWHWSVNGS
jgi:LAS superfamily LD-carboxypeptidase LdcB